MNVHGSGTDFLITSLIHRDLYFISILNIYKAEFGIQPETEVCLLSWGYKLMHHKVQLPVLFKSHDHMLLKMTPSLAQLHWGSEFPSHEEILWENRWRKSSGTNDVPEMVLVFTLLSKHGDQNPEARAVSAGALWFFSLPWHWPTSWLAAVLRIPLKGSSWGFWWLTGNWYTNSPIHFPILKCYFSFYELVPQLYNCVLEIKRPSTEI